MENANLSQETVAENSKRIVGVLADGDVFDRLGDTHLADERRAEQGP